MKGKGEVVVVVVWGGELCEEENLVCMKGEPVKIVLYADFANKTSAVKQHLTRRLYNI